ncbi:MAG: carboxypeptidase-like regulatory domain-containing protein [Lutibacter sp.]|uniref:carboxypeptidase-like regulatory domain-containing protein n=1 Tax=Lutibacter sp. TaxID=1925666 RepID=UPI0017EFED80|nr:carboxypeptidase-like regulatory domain-containing protein [Lutibacter sp.]MBT8317234.1 carboxypeptidase-like regulatory domain-containing protein [Lutibacter sp.]NNJ58093.1 carboxypeptidase-like regulatory domain-containing protein [Lutibacter sp.]
MLKNILYIALLLISIKAFSQEPKVNDTIKNIDLAIFLRGQVVSNADNTPLKGANLFNLNSVVGTISNDEGKFELATRVNDTIYISYVGFQSIKLKITNDLLKGNELVIELNERVEELEEIVVKSHKLIGVLEIDAKNVPVDKYSRIHIVGLQQTYEVGTRARRDYTSPIDALFKPIDFVYNMFGKKPQQLKKLKKLRNEDNLRKMLEGKFNRELMMEYLDLNAQELTELLNECNYSDYFIKTASDLQLIEAILLCYENHKAIKKGSTIRD